MQSVTDMVILITGATDGIGRQAAHELAAAGATVLVHGRNPERGAETLEEIRSATGNERLHYLQADFAALSEVRQLADTVQSRFERLDVLINNAGVGPGKRGAERTTSSDGYELRFAVNYLASFLLTHLLLPRLRQSTPARIVNVSSVGQSPIDFDDVMLERQYAGMQAYRQSKLALILFTFELAGRLPPEEITVNSLHPGSLLDTKMVRETFGEPMGSAQSGAEALVYLATSPELAGVTGKYFDQQRESRANAQAYDAAARRQLWHLSEALTGINRSYA
jgi:NAD(P)-dependent dehydrogenase (short-subunit alcohol dehydrogenase family)